MLEVIFPNPRTPDESPRLYSLGYSDRQICSKVACFFHKLFKIILYDVCFIVEPPLASRNPFGNTYKRSFNIA